VQTLGAKLCTTIKSKTIGSQAQANVEGTKAKAQKILGSVTWSTQNCGWCGSSAGRLPGAAPMNVEVARWTKKEAIAILSKTCTTRHQ